MQKDSKIALIFCGIIVGLLVLSAVFRGNQTATLAPGDSAVSVQNGVQIITIAAKGGFLPSSIEATAGVPTELHIVTNGTYDCSSSLVIPSLGYRSMLKPTGTEIISLSAEQAAGTLDGMCSMGMYTFEIVFRS
jgi:plastocyanin domain-containing protein